MCARLPCMCRRDRDVGNTLGPIQLWVMFPGATDMVTRSEHWTYIAYDASLSPARIVRPHTILVKCCLPPNRLETNIA